MNKTERLNIPCYHTLLMLAHLRFLFEFVQRVNSQKQINLLLL